MKKRRSVLCGLLSMAMILGSVPVTAFAAEAEADCSDIIMNIGSDETERYVSWASQSDEVGNLVIYPENHPEEEKTLTVDAGVGTQITGFAYYYHCKLTGLESETSYVYKVGSDTLGWSDEYTFTTGKEGDNTFRFLVAGDTQISGSGAAGGWQTTLDKAAEWFPDTEFIVSAGDQINDPKSKDQYLGYTAPLQMKSWPTAVTLGNHDDDVADYSERFVVPNPNEDTSTLSSSAGQYGTDYWYTYDGVLFMDLNTNQSGAAAIEGHETFMKNAIQAYKDKNNGAEPVWKIVTFHHSIFSTASHVNDSDVKALRNALPEIFTELGIDAVFMGHDHVYTRTFMMEGNQRVNTEVTDGVTDPDYGQVIYVTANSSSGGKFYGISGNYPWAAVQNQESVPNLTTVKVTPDALSIDTYRTKSGNTQDDILDSFTITRTKAKPENPISTKEVVSTEGTEWKYLDDNTDPGSTEDEKSWTKTEYDDSNWKTAKGSFGARNGQKGDHAGNTENTLLQQYKEGTTTNIPTFFFRTTFDLENPDKLTSLTGNLLYDDGAVVYINGVKVGGFNDGKISGNMSYNNGKGSSDAAAGTFSVTGKDLKKLNLKESGNVLAVELHNDSTSSSDIFLDITSVKAVIDSRDDETAPVLTVPENTSIYRYADFDIMDGVSASDTRDGDLTEEIQISGEVDTKMPGEYTITYTVADAAGNTVSMVRTVTVLSTIGLEFEDADSYTQDKNPDNGSGTRFESADGGTVAANTFDGAWYRFDNVTFGDEVPVGFTVRYSGAANCFDDAKLEIRLDDKDGELIGTVAAPPTGDWGSYASVTAEIDAKEAVKLTGSHSVYLVLRGTRTSGKKYVGNFNRVTFETENQSAKEAYTVNVVNGAGAGNYAYNTKVTVQADSPKEGMRFAGWKADGRIVSTETEYKFYVSNDITLEAIYVAEEEGVEKTAEAILTNLITTESGIKTDVKFVGQIVLPEGYRILEAGLVWSSKDTPLVVDGKLNSSLRPTYVQKISDTNQFSVTIKGMPEGRYLRGRIFAKIADGEGNEKWIYSAEKAAVAK